MDRDIVQNKKHKLQTSKRRGIQEALKDECGCTDDGQYSYDGILLCQNHYNQLYPSVPTNQENNTTYKVPCVPLLTVLYWALLLWQLVRQHIKEVDDLEIE